MIILFASLKHIHANPRRIDRLYRSRLSGLRMEPSSADPWSVVRANHHSSPQAGAATESTAHASDASPGKIATAIAAHKTAVLLVAAAGVAGVTGGIITVRCPCRKSAAIKISVMADVLAKLHSVISSLVSVS